MEVVNDSNQHTPYKVLGTRLKYLREHCQESLAEVSGAVEIEEDKLERIEEGLERPSEDVLMLLMSHFNMLDSEAVQVWELAGYDRKNGPEMLNAEDLVSSGKPVIMLLAVDVRTQYTDGIDIAADQSGLQMTFTQMGGNGNRQPVSKVGMSLEQARAVTNAMQQALLHVSLQRPKGLPSPGDRNGSSGKRRA